MYKIHIWEKVINNFIVFIKITIVLITLFFFTIRDASTCILVVNNNLQQVEIF